MYMWCEWGYIMEWRCIILWAPPSYFYISKLPCTLNCNTQLNSKLGRLYSPKKPQTTTTKPKPTTTFSQLLHKQTRPNSGYNLISTQLEDSWRKKLGHPPHWTTILQVLHLKTSMLNQTLVWGYAYFCQVIPHFDVNNVLLTLKLRYLHYLQYADGFSQF